MHAQRRPAARRRAGWRCHNPSVRERSIRHASLARSALLFFLGDALPLLVALAAVPFLVKRLGVDRFGLLSLAWLLVGYLSILDLGMGRALTYFVASRLGDERREEIGAAVATTLRLLLALGVGAAAVGLVAADFVVTRLLEVPRPLQAEAAAGLRLLALAVPAVLQTSALRGLLEARQRFGLATALRAPVGALTFLAPAAVARVRPDLVAVLGALAALRVAAWLLHSWACRRAEPGFFEGGRFERALVRPLLGLGGWMTVSNVVSPLMVSVDRLVLGGLLSLAAVAHYSVPAEIVGNLGLLPGAVAGVLFPAFASAGSREPGETERLLRRGVVYVLAAVGPVALAVVLLRREGLTLWLGAEFAAASAGVLAVLAVGYWINALARLPFWLLQGLGRPDLTAKLHLAELPLYVGGLLFAASRWGLAGVAAAWTLRVAADAALLVVVSGGLVPALRPALRRSALAAAGGAAVLLLAARVESLPLKLALTCAASAAGAVALLRAERAGPRVPPSAAGAL